MTNVVRPRRSAFRPSWIIASLTLATRQAYAALADDGVVPILEGLDELVAVRDAADGFDFFPTGVRPRVRDVFGDGAVEQEIVLQHDAEMRPIVAQLDIVDVD